MGDLLYGSSPFLMNGSLYAELRQIGRIHIGLRAPDHRLDIGDALLLFGTAIGPLRREADGALADPEATAKRLRNGWLHTGDVGYLDGEGYLHLVDRLDRMIKTRGVKVYPAAIEDVLLAQPAVGQAAVGTDVEGTDPVAEALRHDQRLTEHHNHLHSDRAWDEFASFDLAGHNHGTASHSYAHRGKQLH